MKKKNAGMIDNELRAISPELLLGYEKKNLGGRSLREINIRHQQLKGEMSDLFRTMSLLVVVLGLLFGLYLLSVDKAEKYSDLKVLLAFVGTLVSFAVSSWRYYEKQQALESESLKCEAEMTIFTKFVEQCFGVIDNMTLRIDRDNIHTSLVSLAENVIRLERMFELKISFRADHAGGEGDIVQIGNWLMQSRRNFNDACECAEAFGVEINRRELFDQARWKMDSK